MFHPKYKVHSTNNALKRIVGSGRDDVHPLSGPVEQGVGGGRFYPLTLFQSGGRFHPKKHGAFDKQCIKKNSWQWEG